MISIVVGVSNLAIGLAYAGLGILSAWEAIELHRYRGWSRFGLGFSMMAASCGPHHIVHGWHVLQGGSVSVPMLAATLIGLPAGLVFVLLRLETMWGGQGDRLIGASADLAAILVGTFAITAGWLGASAFGRSEAGFVFQALCISPGLEAGVPDQEAWSSIVALSFLANVFVTVTYGMVGWYLADHQVRRHIASGGWSLSGVALTGVFFTCALMHLMAASSRGNGLMLLFDVIGIPASVYFLWVVRKVHNDSLIDWNRRPLVGAAAAPERPSPWSGGSAHR